MLKIKVLAAGLALAWGGAPLVGARVVTDEAGRVEARLCGRLEDGAFSGEDGQSYNVFLRMDAPLEERLRAQDLLNARFVGNNVCLEDVQVSDATIENGPIIALDRSTRLALDLRFPVRDVLTSNCEGFVDKIAPVHIFHELSPYGSFSTIALRFYVKVLPERLDGTVRSVRFYGFDHFPADDAHGDIDVHFAPLQGRPWLSTTDYYEFEDLAPAGSWRKGAFYIETDRGARYWVNAGGGALSDFVIDPEFVVDVEKNIGSFGQRLGAPDGHIHSAPDDVPLNLARLPKTADAFPSLNPFRCK